MWEQAGPFPPPRMEFWAAFVASLTTQTAYSLDATGVARRCLSVPQECRKCGGDKFSFTSLKKGQLCHRKAEHWQHLPERARPPVLGLGVAVLGSASPCLGLGQLGFLFCGPDDWLCLQFAIVFIANRNKLFCSPSSLLGYRGQSTGCSQGCGGGSGLVSRLRERAGDGMQVAVQQALALQQLGTARGRVATKAGTCREGYVFCLKPER